MTKTRVCLAGATGWVGKVLSRAIVDSEDLELTGATAQKSAGQDIGELLWQKPLGIKISANINDALTAGADVLIDYSTSQVVKHNSISALQQGVSVVIGTSGLTSADFSELEQLAVKQKLGIIASGNFAITAALVNHFSLIAAKYLPQWEIIDYGHAAKLDAPSGTGRELAERMAKVKHSEIGRPLNEIHGAKEARGADIAGSQVHSVRLNGFTFSFESLFGLPDERLCIRHDAGNGAEPYVAGTLLAVRKVKDIVGVVRGLDTLMFGAG